MKKILIVFISLLLILNLTGCNKSPLETYKNATERTRDVKVGKKSIEVFIENEYVTEGLTSEEVKKLNYFNSIETKINIEFDDNKNKFVSRNYSNFGGMGFDFNIYGDGEKIYVKMPVVGKYLVIDSGDNLKDKEETIKMPISEESLETINDKWISLLNKKDVVSGDKTLLDTENGQVKATLFTISLTEEQIKTFIGEVIKIVVSDSNFIDYITNELEMNYLELLKNLDKINEMAKNFKINSINYNAYIDIDGYIVQSSTNLDISYLNSDLGGLKSQKISIENKLWDIGKKQTFEFPTVNQDNILEMENIDEGIPFIFEGITNSSK